MAAHEPDGQTPRRAASRAHAAESGRRRRPELLWVLATALVATLVAIVDLKLWRMDPHVPIFGASGDGAYYLATVKDVVDHGWFWHNPDLGAPFGQSNYDFAAPFGDTAHYVIVWVLGLVLGDPVLVFNAFFLLCFPLIAVVAYAVLRDLGAAPAPALVAGVLFAFLPYHLRAQPAAPVPHVVLRDPARRLARRGRRRGPPAADATRRAAPHAARGRRLPARGAASNYYAVFALLVLLTVVPVAAIARRSTRDRAAGRGRHRARRRELRAVPRAGDRLSARPRRQRRGRQAPARARASCSG